MRRTASSCWSARVRTKPIWPWCRVGMITRSSWNSWTTSGLPSAPARWSTTASTRWPRCLNCKNVPWRIRETAPPRSSLFPRRRCPAPLLNRPPRHSTAGSWNIRAAPWPRQKRPSSRSCNGCTVSQLSDRSPTATSARSARAGGLMAGRRSISGPASRGTTMNSGSTSRGSCASARCPIPRSWKASRTSA